MKQCIWILAVLSLISFSSVAQTKKRGNRFDTTLSKKHEFSIALGMSSPAWRPRSIGMPTFSVGYTRVFKSNHFLRTGLRYSRQSLGRRSGYGPLSAFPGSPDPSDPSDPMPLEYTVTRTQRDGRLQDHYLGAFVGYEYGIGFRRFRFTFGGDLHIGYNYRTLTQNSDVFQETRTLDPNTNMFNYNIQFLEYSRFRGVAHGIYVGIVPRIGIRRDFGRRIALALTFTPQINLSTTFATRVLMKEGTASAPYFNKGGLQLDANVINAEFRVIFKLGKN